jgi:hypothetical protein
MNDNTNILIFPSGSGVAKEIYDSLKYIRNINLFGGEGNDNNFTNFLFEKTIFDIPMIKDEVFFINELNKIIDENKIDYIYPAYDIIHWFLSKNKSKINAKILVSDFETCDVCISKTRTYNLLKNVIDVPRFIDEEAAEIEVFPMFMKPDDGCASRDSYKICNVEELNFYKKRVKNYILLEYLPYDEFTIDCFTNSNGKLIFSAARQRKKTIAGMSVYTKNVLNVDFTPYANKINNLLKFNGAWFFQMKYDQNMNLKLLEVAPRIPGAMSLYRNKGINFPLLTLRQFQGEQINNVLLNNYEIECYKVYESKYITTLLYDYIYIDLDDTIIIKNKVNVTAIQFLYQALNQKKQIYLITRNIFPISILEKFKISKDIFNKIMIVKPEEKKSSYITYYDSIFIDDSFKEREDVYTTKNISVFNLDMIESLLNTKY